MANKKKQIIEDEIPQVEELVVKQPKMVIKEKPLPTPENTWEIKDRNYYLIGNMSPLTYSIRSSNVFYFDEERGYERELMYTSNQKTPFVDEFPKESQARLEHSF